MTTLETPNLWSLLTGGSYSKVIYLVKVENGTAAQVVVIRLAQVDCISSFMGLIALVSNFYK